tara:strand:- start:435 stop:710 length:276 start_codon:yes stop_codon:yes gene_type:complete
LQDGTESASQNHSAGSSIYLSFLSANPSPKQLVPLKKQTTFWDIKLINATLGEIFEKKSEIHAFDVRWKVLILAHPTRGQTLKFNHLESIW